MWCYECGKTAIQPRGFKVMNGAYIRVRVSFEKWSLWGVLASRPKLDTIFPQLHSCNQRGSWRYAYFKWSCGGNAAQLKWNIFKILMHVAAYTRGFTGNRQYCYKSSHFSHRTMPRQRRALVFGSGLGAYCVSCVRCCVAAIFRMGRRSLSSTLRWSPQKSDASAEQCQEVRQECRKL